MSDCYVIDPVLPHWENGMEGQGVFLFKDWEWTGVVAEDGVFDRDSWPLNTGEADGWRALARVVLQERAVSDHHFSEPSWISIGYRWICRPHWLPSLQTYSRSLFLDGQSRPICDIDSIVLCKCTVIHDEIELIRFKVYCISFKICLVSGKCVISHHQLGIRQLVMGSTTINARLLTW